MLRKPVLAVLSALSLFAQDAPGVSKSTSAMVPVKSEATPRARLDHDLLDPAYFGIDGALMKETKVADFMWVKPGFSFKGHTLKIEWEKPCLLVPKDEKLDLDVADHLTKVLPREFAKAMSTSLWPSAKVSTTEGDLVLTGRIVMINVRSRFSFSKNILTFDLKIMNAATKEVVLACHHRVIPYGVAGSGEESLEYRVSTYAFEFSEYCLAGYTN
jgi:hypothetical protein